MLVTEGTIDGYFPVEGIGAIDLLAKSNDGMEWLVIAVKGDNDRDKTVGKLLCHMGWVQKHLADLHPPILNVSFCRLIGKFFPQKLKRY